MVMLLRKPLLRNQSNRSIQQIDQPTTSIPTGDAGYRLRSMDTQLASQIIEAVSGLTQKEQLTLRGVANSKRFSSFTEMANRTPQNALEILRKRFPKSVAAPLLIPTGPAATSASPPKVNLLLVIPLILSWVNNNKTTSLDCPPA